MFSQTWLIRVDKMVGTFNPKHTYTKRGISYFSKDVPADLRHHYTKLRIVQSLRTKSPIRAKHAAQSLVTRPSYLGGEVVKGTEKPPHLA
jgi:hypothetical protein